MVDEFGATQGVLTLQDILETIVGELPAHDEDDQGYFVRRDDGSLLCEGAIPLEELREVFPNCDFSTADTNIETLSGLILLHLGEIPRVGQKFEICDLKMEILDMDSQRIDRVLIEPNSTA